MIHLFLTIAAVWVALLALIVAALVVTARVVRSVDPAELVRRQYGADAADTFAHADDYVESWARAQRAQVERVLADSRR